MSGSASTVKTVVLTLRQIAGWGPMSSEELHEVASHIEGLGVARLGADDICCPACEEIQCDEDCPLAAVRGTAHDESRAAADADADQLHAYAVKKWGPDGSNTRRLDQEFDGDGT